MIAAHDWVCDDIDMDNFRAGFADELLEITKEAKPKAKHSAPSRFKAMAASEAGRSAGRKALTSLRSGSRGVLSAALFAKLVNPDIGVGSALKRGVGVTAGGHIAASMARQLGIRGSKSQLVASILGSAMGFRATRSTSKKKSRDEEFMERALKESR